MIFNSLNHVPRRLRKLKGIALAKPQLDAMLDRAVELSAGPHDFPRALAEARREFMDNHVEQGSAWVLRGGNG